MTRDSAPHESDLDTLIMELLAPRSHRKGASQSNGNGESVLTDALTTALARALSEASPLDRALFAEAMAPAVADELAPALADALTPALADALTPALATALGGLFTPKKAPPPRASQDKTSQGSEPSEPEEGARKHDRK
jgi:hypothetical protein